MKTLAIVAVGVVAALHLGFLTLEMFFWDHPVGRDVFGMTEEESGFSAALAANQGLYNGFLAVGLLWGLLARKHDVVVFFLLCVVVAGVFGAATASFTILYLQALPGAFALGLTLLMVRSLRR